MEVHINLESFMKLVFLTLFVLIVSHVQAEPTETQKQLIVLRQQWNNDLNSYLINHQDPNIAMFGLYRAALRNKQVVDIAETLNQLLENETLSTQGLLLAADICGRDDMVDLCDVQTTSKKLIQSEPLNLAVYLVGLNLAVEQMDDKKSKKLLKKMTQSQNNNIYFYSPEKLESIVENYIILNAIDDKLKQSELNQLKQIKTISDSESEQFQNNYQQYNITSTLMSFKFIQPFPNFRNLLDACKKDKNEESNCLKIADVMIGKGKSFITKTIGHSIKEEIYQANDNQLKYEQILMKKENLKHQMECISKISAGRSFFDTFFNLDNYKSFSKVERNQGEQAAFTQLAESSYQKQLDINPEKATDPQSCFD